MTPAFLSGLARSGWSMVVLVRVRRLLAQRPWLYWAGVAGLALLVGVLVSRATTGIEDAKAAWGESRRVLVAVGDVEAGAPVVELAEWREVPAPMVPQGAVTELTAGATARQHVAAGEIVVRHDVVATGAPQALIPPGWLAVSLAEPVPSGVRTGDAVGVASGGVLLAPEGVVVGTLGDAVLVAVPASEAPTVAQAASTGDVALLVKPG